MRVPCPACDILFDVEDLNGCPVCGREPPRTVRDPGPDDRDLVADGVGEYARPLSTTVEAVALDVDVDADDLPVDEWTDVEKRPVVVEARRVDERTEVDTREGTVVAEPGDVLMRGVEGEAYPCDPDIFEETYRQPTGGQS